MTSNAAIETRKELRKTFDLVCAITDELILLNRFSVADLKTYFDKSERRQFSKWLDKQKARNGTIPQSDRNGGRFCQNHSVVHANGCNL